MLLPSAYIKRRQHFQDLQAGQPSRRLISSSASPLFKLCDSAIFPPDSTRLLHVTALQLFPLPVRYSYNLLFRFHGGVFIVTWI
ncbi:hypothetical protein E2C01_100060 [Portunus trituberculatus]|uniref:Uncharacterized protein n=1 Tax=Portunus trituberculatus TaxID=210409 RepID=A0A5B7KBZ9_PORTR|nr:hypothetical protein [Portunus trituberculatus]